MRNIQSRPAWWKQPPEMPFSLLCVTGPTERTTVTPAKPGPGGRRGVRTPHPLTGVLAGSARLCAKPEFTPPGRGGADMRVGCGPQASVGAMLSGHTHGGQIWPVHISTFLANSGPLKTQLMPAGLFLLPLTVDPLVRRLPCCWRVQRWNNVAIHRRGCSGVGAEAATGSRDGDRARDSGPRRGMVVGSASGSLAVTSSSGCS